MIVNTGKVIIINYFGGQVGNIGDTIALGTGTTPAALANTSLATEVTLIAVTAIAADTANSRIIFRGILPPGVMTTISEIGIYASGSLPSVRTLVARTVLGSPLTVDPDLPTEIEYSLEITV